MRCPECLLHLSWSKFRIPQLQTEKRQMDKQLISDMFWPNLEFVGNKPVVNCQEPWMKIFLIPLSQKSWCWLSLDQALHSRGCKHLVCCLEQGKSTSSAPKASCTTPCLFLQSALHRHGSWVVLFFSESLSLIAMGSLSAQGGQQTWTKTGPVALDLLELAASGNFEDVGDRGSWKLRVVAGMTEEQSLASKEDLLWWVGTCCFPFPFCWEGRGACFEDVSLQILKMQERLDQQEDLHSQNPSYPAQPTLQSFELVEHLLCPSSIDPARNSPILRIEVV